MSTAPNRVLACAVLVACAIGAEAGSAGMTRLPGGGASHTDCMIVTDVSGIASLHGRVARCVDGDPACDGDGAADGRCTVGLRLCLDAVVEQACTPEPLARVQLHGPATLAPLADDLHALAMPVVEAETCTPTRTVTVPTRSRRPGRLRLRAMAAMASGPVDRDRVTIVCRPAPRPVTLEQVQRAVFTPSCTTFSCHGTGRAGGLELTPEASAASLLGVPPSNDAARAAGLLRVAPGDPDGSFLMRKLLGTLATDEGERMPNADGTLPPTRVELVRRWIAGL